MDEGDTEKKVEDEAEYDEKEWPHCNFFQHQDAVVVMLDFLLSVYPGSCVDPSFLTSHFFPQILVVAPHTNSSMK